MHVPAGYRGTFIHRRLWKKPLGVNVAFSSCLIRFRDISKEVKSGPLLDIVDGGNEL